METKKRIFESNVLSVLLYGAQTWALTEGQLLGLARTQIAMERSMLNIKRKDKISNTSIRNRTKIMDCRYKCKKLKFNYAGHVARGEGGDRWERKVLEWTPRGQKRKVGRPKIRWEDEIIRHSGIAWKRTVSNRDRWKRVGEAYAQGWAH